MLPLRKYMEYFEFPLFEKVFFDKLNPEYVEQFRRVVWPESGLHHLLDTYFEFPDFKTDEASMLLYVNMKRYLRQEWLLQILSGSKR